MTSYTGAVPDTRRTPACRDDADLMFETNATSVALAKSICGGCPVRAACLAWALNSEEEHGVWGGKSGPERRAILRRRAAAGEKPAPRKGGRPRAACGVRNGVGV
jgi:WhiB family redox-sensing transcriptional regulator